MNRPEDIRIEEYDYPLPDERIAKFPVPGRDTSKLLLYRGGKISETVFNKLPDQLPSDTLLVFNNTRVIQARIRFRKESGANIEVFCLEPDTPSDYAMSFQSTARCRWLCLVGNSKKVERRRTPSSPPHKRAGDNIACRKNKRASGRQHNRIPLGRPRHDIRNRTRSRRRITHPPIP